MPVPLFNQVGTEKCDVALWWKLAWKPNIKFLLPPPKIQRRWLVFLVKCVTTYLRLWLVTVIMMCVVTVMLLIWLLWFWCVWWLWCHWFGYGNVSKLLLLLLCYMGLTWSLFWEVWEISAQAHLQMVEAIIAGNIRWNRVRSFSPSWDVVQYVITEPSN